MHYVCDSFLGRGCSLSLMLQTLTSRSMLQDRLMEHGWGCSTEPPQKVNCLVFMALLFAWCWRGTLTNAIIVSGVNITGKNEWVSWNFLCWGRGGTQVVGRVTKGFGQLALLYPPHAWVLIVGWGSWGKRVHSWAIQSMILTCCSLKVWLAVLRGQRRPDLQLLCIWSSASMVLLRQGGCLTPTRKYPWEDSTLSPI